MTAAGISALLCFIAVLVTAILPSPVRGEGNGGMAASRVD
jgi:hypothetical protein